MKRQLVTIAAALSLLICLVTVLLWVRSFRHTASTGWLRSDGYVEFDSTDGVFDATLAWDLPAQSGGVRHWALRRSIYGRLPSLFRFEIIKTAKPPEGAWRFGNRTVITTSAPYWFLVAITGFLPLCWWVPRLRKRISPRVGFCPACGYDLTANTTGVCSECGVTVSEATIRYELRWRRASLAMIALPLLLLAPFAGLTGFDHYRGHQAREKLLARQQRLLDYTAPADRVVYEESPIPARRLLTMDPTYLPIGSCAGYVPMEFREPFPGLSLGVNGGPVLFVHARRSLGGTNRLVVVGLMSVRDAEDLRADSIIPSSNGLPGPRMISESQLVIARPFGQHVTFLSGQPDGPDGSHFTIVYSIDNHSGTIDGWLLDSGGVKMQVRDGPAKTLGQSTRAGPFKSSWMGSR